MLTLLPPIHYVHPIKCLQHRRITQHILFDVLYIYKEEIGQCQGDKG